jgi:hypothetical protein
MRSKRFFCRFSVITVLAAAVFMAGCADASKKGKTSTTGQAPQKAETAQTPVKPVKSGEGVVLTLKFSKGDTATYKSIMESERSADFAGEITKDAQFKSGRSGTRAEVVFSQQTQDVDERGNAAVRITIKSLKYLVRTKDVVSLNFDSSNKDHQTNALNKLIGQSYTITVSPAGEVTAMTGQEEIKGAVAGDLMENKAAAQLVSFNIVQRRHQVPAIMDANNKQYNVGDKWSSNRAVSFGAMGSNTFEKIYTLKAIGEKGGRKTAVVEINGIPATSQKEQGSPVTKMFDSNNNYTGTLLLDLKGGKIEKYSEKLQSQWVVADPAAAGKEGEPSTIKLGTMELYSLEEIK